MSEAEPAAARAGMNDRWRLHGRVALVTGASAGLGARFAHVLHAAGAHVIATARRADRLEQLARHCGSRIQTTAGDIADPRHRQAVVDMLRLHGHLDVLVNNAGICDDGPLEHQDLEDLRRVVEVNLISVMDLCRLAADLLRAAPAASVINVASIYGIVASPNPMAAYNATKAALIGLTRHLAAVWDQDGIRVNALVPGYFPTELTGFLADPRLRPVHPRPHAAGAHPGDRRARRPAALPRHRRLQLHDRASPRHRRRMDRGMTRPPQRQL